MKQPTFSRVLVQFHFRVPSARLIILTERTDGARESGWKETRKKGRENVTGKGGHVLLWKTKRRDSDGTAGASGNVSLNRWGGEEERQKIEWKKREEVGAARGKNRSSGGGPEYNASNAGTTSRHLTTTKKDPRTIYWLKSREFMRRFALAGGSTRDEKPKFLSNSPFSLITRFLSYSSSLFIRDSLYMGELQGNWRGQRNVLLNAINI